MESPILSAIFICFIAVGGITLLIYKRTSRIIAEISQKYENLEKLLLDIREGTRDFYKEKRRFLRVRNGISARIGGSELFEVIDISYKGALLRTTQHLKPQDKIELNIYLPIFPQPINVQARVIRVSSARIEGQPETFIAGVEFLEMNRLDKEKLTETVGVLEKSPPR